MGWQQDPETGLYYFRHRLVHAQLGRFLSRDPIGYVDGAHLYQYVLGHPSTSVDSAGLFSRSPCIATHPDPKNDHDDDILYLPIDDWGPNDDTLFLLARYTAKLTGNTVRVSATALAVYMGDDFFGSDETADTEELVVSTTSTCQKNDSGDGAACVWDGGSSPSKGPKAVSTNEGDMVTAAVSIQTSGQGTSVLTVVVEAMATHQSLITENHGISIGGEFGVPSIGKISGGYKFGIEQKPGGHQVKVRNTFDFPCRCNGPVSGERAGDDGQQHSKEY